MQGEEEMNYLTESLIYVMSDQYFWIAMTLTTMCGLFVGASIYDGILEDVKKGIVSISFYTLLIVMTNLSRILPIVYSGAVHSVQQPFASTITTLLVTIFYILGMWLGVRTVKHAHSDRHYKRRSTDK